MSDASEEPEKSKRKPKKSQLLPFDWKANNAYLEVALVNEMLAGKNFKGIFGQEKGENTTKETKISAYQRIAEKIVPESYALNSQEAANRCKSKGETLVKTYKQLAKCLRQTGDGVRNPDSPANVYLVDYISPEGPTEANTPEIKNIWGA
ncbi:hypothetical protein AAF712_014622 [Marasmius tenuissimus]|uniref:Uncharacterized protein n=1 Tax=Marasmius tenuissimus TaxID=585030 RepID=A0ABR2ZBL9_9AGAR